MPSIIEGDDETAYALDRPEFVKYDKHVGSTSIQNRFQKIDAAENGSCVSRGRRRSDSKSGKLEKRVQKMAK